MSGLACGCLIELPADARPPYPHDYSPGNVGVAVGQSLRRLRTDRLDLVQVHMSPDRATLEDHHTMEALQGLRDEAGLSATEFVLRFTLTHPGLSTTIVGTANPGHLAGNIAISEKGPLPADLYDKAKKLLPR